MAQEKVKAVLSLDNCILSEERLKHTPSVADGLSVDDEVDVRIVGCDFIQSAGILLRLPQVAMATAQILFQRFFYSKSLVKHSYEHTAMACLFLAAKIEEAPRRVRDVINVFHHIKQFWNEKPFEAMEFMGNQYFIAKNAVIKAERRILKELGFCVHVKHPHKLITTYLQILEYEKNKKLVQLAWNYMNDSLRSNVFVRYSPETIACACIHIAARKLKDQVPLPTNPPWYWLFDVSLDDMEMVSYTILSLYERKKRSPAEIEQCLTKANEARKAKKGEEDGISNANSPAVGSSSPRSDSPQTVASTTASEKPTAHENDAESLDQSGRTESSPVNSPQPSSSDAAKHVENGRHYAPSPSGSASVSPVSNTQSSRSPANHHGHSRSRSRSLSRSRSRSPSRSSRSRSRSSSVEHDYRRRYRSPHRRERVYSPYRSPVRRRDRRDRYHRDWVDRDRDRRHQPSRRYVDDRDRRHRRR